MDRSSASALAKEAIDRGDSHFSLLKEVSALSGGDRLSTEDDDDEQQQDQQNQEQPEQHERKEGNGPEQSKQRLWAQVFEECTTLENACRRMFHQHLRAVSEKQHRIAKLLSNKMSAFHAQLKAQDKNINYLVDVRRVRVVLFEHTSRTLEVLEAQYIGSLTFYGFSMFLHVSPCFSMFRRSLSLSVCVCVQVPKVYVAFLLEIARRRRSTSHLKIELRTANLRLNRLREQEMEHRETFIRRHGRAVVADLVPAIANVRPMSIDVSKQQEQNIQQNQHSPLKDYIYFFNPAENVLFFYRGMTNVLW
jgi:hypothetical protein